MKEDVITKGGQLFEGRAISDVWLLSGIEQHLSLYGVKGSISEKGLKSSVLKV
jgi:hypothetical protein